LRQAFELWGQRGWHNQEVAGESNYFDAIQKVIGPVDDRGTETVVTAELVPEPTNRHDKNAVQVLIQGLTVGYLPREDAQRYQPVLSKLLAQDYQPHVGARVWGRMATEYDYDRKGQLVERQQFVGSVRLDLAEPHLLTPANLPPYSTYVVLPIGGAIQVTDEDKHMPNLVPLLSAEGECWVHTTMHEITESTARTTKNLVEVRIDEAVAGKLTPKMSSELLPVIRHMHSKGIVTVCRAILKGNQLKADVTLYVARTGDISAEWLAEPPVTAAARRTGDADLIEAPNTAADLSRGQWRFNAPPGWPPPPPGWVPPQGWVPPAHLPVAPAGWQWWVAA